MLDDTSLVTKRCSQCKVTKALSEFWVDRSRIGGRDHRCRECRTPDRRRRDKGRKRGPRSSFRPDLSAGVQGHMTYSEYLVMLESQGGNCAICGGQDRGRRLTIDHCHKTGRIRGLLCRRCNIGLGSLGDDLESIERVRSYLLASN